jgi:hypothetical protein
MCLNLGGSKMGKFDAAIPGAYTTASSYAVTTKDALFHGISVFSGATATVGKITVCVANATGKAIYAVTALTSGGFACDGPITPVVCAGGITCVSTGTAHNSVVLFSEL